MRLTLRTDLAAADAARFEDLFLSLCEPRVRSWLVQEYLTAEERSDLGQVGPRVTKLISILVSRRGRSQERTILALADFCGLIGPIEYRTLLRAIGESPVQGATESSFEQRESIEQRPRWDSAAGTFWFGDKILRKLKTRKSPTHSEVILAAFQDANWRSPICQPFSDRQFPPDLYRTIHYLNRKLPLIRFRVQRNGGELAWERSPERSVSEV